MGGKGENEGLVMEMRNRGHEGGASDGAEGRVLDSLELF